MKSWLFLVLLILHLISAYAKTPKQGQRHKSSSQNKKFYNETLQYRKKYNIKDLGVRMVNGSTARTGYFPWTAALLCPKFDTAILDLVFPKGDPTFKIQTCGASLLTSKFLITAAHCFFVPAIGSPRRPFCVQYWFCEPLFRYSASQLQVVVGILDTAKLGSYPRYNVAKIYPHPDYNIQTLANDVGLIRLYDNAPIPFTQNVYGIGIWNEFVHEGVDAIIAGWGANCWENLTDPNLKKKEKKRIYDLKYIKIKTTKYENCNKYYMNYDKTINNTICAGAKNKNVGQGDSGGGLYITNKNGTNYLIGVVSTIITCGNTDPGMVYSVFTRLSTFRNWVYNTMNESINNNNIKNMKNPKLPQSIDIFDWMQNSPRLPIMNNNNKNTNKNNDNKNKNTNNIVQTTKNVAVFPQIINNSNNKNKKNNKKTKNNKPLHSINLGDLLSTFNMLSQNIFKTNTGNEFPFNMLTKKTRRST